MSEQEQEDRERLNDWLRWVEDRQPYRLTVEDLRYIAESRMARAVSEGRFWLERREGADCWAKRYAEDVAALLRHIAALEGELQRWPRSG